jgi:hypothetical protein
MISASSYFNALGKPKIFKYIKSLYYHICICDVDKILVIQPIYNLANYVVNIIVFYHKSFEIMEEHMKYVIVSCFWIIYKLESDYDIPIERLEKFTSLDKNVILQYEWEILHNIKFNLSIFSESLYKIKQIKQMNIVNSIILQKNIFLDILL